MTTRPVSSSIPADVLKQLEKELAQEAKVTDRAIKDLANSQKAEEKMKKLADKAEKQVHKTEAKELSAKKALKKAEHQHNIAAVNVKSSEDDAKIKHDQQVKLQKEIDKAKSRLDAAMERKDAKAREIEEKSV